TAMQSTRAATTESAIWGRVLVPGCTRLSQEAVRPILKIDFPQADKTRMHKLAAKARTGALTPEEQDAIDAYVRMWSFIQIMKSKSRTALRKIEGNGSRS